MAEQREQDCDRSMEMMDRPEPSDGKTQDFDREQLLESCLNKGLSRRVCKT